MITTWLPRHSQFAAGTLYQSAVTPFLQTAQNREQRNEQHKQQTEALFNPVTTITQSLACININHPFDSTNLISAVVVVATNEQLAWTLPK